MATPEFAGTSEPAMDQPTGEPALAPSRGWVVSLLAKLDEELLEVEAAQDLARDAGRWRQYDTLCGQKTGLLQAKRWLKETQPNDQAQARRTTDK